HEKGAFTGAFTQKIGRFEMADTGTLFLDEIGDMPLGLQPKLLRVLQEQEFERVGSGRTHRINVRVVAATHRDLTEMVARKEFRSDLYYRINVFPVALPPLRERRQDIPQLASHFVEVCARRMGKQIDHIPQDMLAAFTSYAWPGNVRELQNLVERAVIRSNNGVLVNPLVVSEPQWSEQNRPCVVTSKPGIWDGSGRGPYLSRFLVIRQVCFSSPAPRSAFQDVPVVKQTIEHGGDRGTIAEQFAPVFHRAVGS